MASRSLIAAALVMGLAGAADIALAQVPPAPVVVQPTPKQSKFERLATKTATLQRRTEVPVQAAGGENVGASVVRLDDLTAHETAMALQLTLPEGHGVVAVSEEEMQDLKDSVQYILQNLTNLNDSTDYIRVEYRTLSGASIGYMVHFATDTGGEWPPTAYVHMPSSPFYPQSGGIERLTIQGLQRIIGEAQQTMATLRQPQEKK